MTLSDKVIKSSILNQHIQVKDLKKAVKELENWILSNGHHDNNEDLTYVPQGELLTIMTGIFGRELCK
jgi:hypothetical protein